MANIKLNNNEYQIPNSALAAPTADFIAHLQTIAGEGLRIVVGGVGYNVDPSKVSGAIADLHVTLGGLSGSDNGSDDSVIVGTEGLLYSVSDDGTYAIVTGYEGAKSDVIIANMYEDLPVTSIGDGAFAGCANLTSITIPDGVTDIGFEAFGGCESLTSVTIGNGVTSIGDGAFAGCANLTSITIPDGVTSIGESAFEGCVSLTSITIPDGVTDIGLAAFMGCSGLTSATIGNGATRIGDWAFRDCTSLASVTIGNGVPSIGNCAFYSCTSLMSITFNGTVEQWNAIEKGTVWNVWNAEVPATYVQCSDGQVAIIK